MAAALLKKVLSRSIGVKVLDLGGVKFFSNEKNLVKKAHGGRHKCMLHTPTEEKPSNKEGRTTFDSAQGLINHIKRDHKKPGAQRELFCQHCGNLKGMEDECQFLSPHQQPCPALPKMSKAQVNAILVQQYRDRKE